MKIDLYCPSCDNHVQVDTADWFDDQGFEDAVMGWCATAHIRPVRMEQHDPHAD